MLIVYVSCTPSYGYGDTSNSDGTSQMQILQGRTYGCKTKTVTSWVTTTATKTVTGIESIVTTKTVAKPTTIHDTRTVIQETTIWVPTTYIETKTIVSEHPVTRTVDNTKYTTKSTTIYTTIVSTVTTSYPVVSTITQTLSRPTITVPGQNVTQTQTRQGPTIAVPGQPSTITVPGATKTLPGSTVLTTITRTIPPSTVRVTQEQGTKTITQPASTVVETRTQTLPAVTIDRPASTVTVTPIINASLCPAPTGLSAPLDPKSNRTFGCEPGHICNPPKPQGCNLWRDPPSDDYLCDPKYCIPSLPYTNVTWKECETSYYPPSYGYFNLNPEAFGLSYDIFEYKVIQKTVSGHVTTITTGNWDSQTSLTAWPKPTPTSSTAVIYGRTNKVVDKLKGCKNKRGITPAVCYQICNAPYLVAQAVGKTDALCAAGLEFRNGYESCNRCISANGLNVTIVDYVGPEFLQFLNYCNGMGTEKPPTSSHESPEPIVTKQPSVETSSQVATSQPAFTPIQSTVDATSPTSYRSSASSSPAASSSPQSSPAPNSSTPSASAPSSSAPSSSAPNSSNTGSSSQTSGSSSSPTSGSGSTSPPTTSGTSTTSTSSATSPSSTNQATTSGSGSTSGGNGNTSGSSPSVSTKGTSSTGRTHNATIPVVTSAASHLSGLYYSAASLVLSSLMIIMY